MALYGAIVEGDTDVGVYEEIVRKVLGPETQFVALVAGDRAQLMKTFPALLRRFEHISAVGGPVDKALVIRDADRKDPVALEAEMQHRMRGRTYPFSQGVAVQAVSQAMETWLLADARAINSVAMRRGGRTVGAVRSPLETIEWPKQVFQDLLSRARLLYTAQVCREIAHEIDLAILRVACPSFVRFEENVVDP